MAECGPTCKQSLQVQEPTCDNLSQLEEKNKMASLFEALRLELAGGPKMDLTFT